MSLFGDHTIAFYLELKMIDCRTFIYYVHKYAQIYWLPNILTVSYLNDHKNVWRW